MVPPSPETFLTLMGLSNGVYLVNKFLPSGGLTKDQAEAKLTAGGDTTVTGLTQGSDGGWTGIGTKGGVAGPVKVAKDGTVSAG